jgi:hypothetical protein
MPRSPGTQNAHGFDEFFAGGRGGSLDGLLRELLGRPPITIDRFLEEFAGEFRGQAAKA